MFLPRLPMHVPHRPHHWLYCSTYILNCMVIHCFCVSENLITRKINACKYWPWFALENGFVESPPACAKRNWPPRRLNTFTTTTTPRVPQPTSRFWIFIQNLRSFQQNWFCQWGQYQRQSTPCSMRSLRLSKSKAGACYKTRWRYFGKESCLLFKLWLKTNRYFLILCSGISWREKALSLLFLLVKEWTLSREMA